MDRKLQIRRISQMEQRLDSVSAAAKQLSAALDAYEAVKDDLDALGRYYDSRLWRQDFADDEAGLLPEGLKRGVLSEDALWNLLAKCRELNERMKKE